jgi:hypothetical protein
MWEAAPTGADGGTVARGIAPLGAVRLRTPPGAAAGWGSGWAQGSADGLSLALSPRSRLGIRGAVYVLRAIRPRHDEAMA